MLLELKDLGLLLLRLQLQLRQVKVLRANGDGRDDAGRRQTRRLAGESALTHARLG